MSDVYTTNREPDRNISYQDILDAIEKLKEMEPRSQALYFYCPGDGRIDKIAIDYWSDSWIIVVDHNGDRWLQGRKMV